MKITNETVKMTVKAVIDARDPGLRVLEKEYREFKKVLCERIREAVRPVVKDRAIEVYAQQKWQIYQDLWQYIKNYPMHPMPFHNQSVTLLKENGFFKMEFKIHPNHREGKKNPVCTLIVPKKYYGVLEKACGERNPILGEVRIKEDPKYGRFNVHITLRLPKPEPYEPRGWIGVDIGWRQLVTCMYCNGDVVTNLMSRKMPEKVRSKAKELHRISKEFKTRIIQLKHLLKVKQRAKTIGHIPGSYRVWEGRLREVQRQAIGKIAKLLCEIAKELKCGIRMEKLTFRSHTKRFLIPRYRLQAAIKTLCERMGIPCEIVSAYKTSVTCNKCGKEGVRKGKRFVCPHCGYDVDADVNAAINIARGGVTDTPRRKARKASGPRASRQRPRGYRASRPLGPTGDLAGGSRNPPEPVTPPDDIYKGRGKPGMIEDRVAVKPTKTRKQQKLTEYARLQQ